MIFSFSKLAMMLVIAVVILMIFRTVKEIQKPRPKKRKRVGPKPEQPAKVTQGEALVACPKCGVFRTQGKPCPDCGTR